ncbi:MAG: hypothetical protein GQ583_12700 [Methyloprofundus sp.]|nr:hypothetical protein [Methyloprofundus sp.]
MKIAHLKQDVLSYDSWQLAAKLTLLTLLLSPVGDWFIRPFILSLCVIGLLISDLWRSASLWGALALLTGTRVYLDWPLADNHAYLLSYWCLAFALSAWFQNKSILQDNARYLIGLTFAFAAWQKWAAPDYINGVFFLTTFLLDERFENFVVLFSSITFEQIDMARDYLEGDYRFEPAAEQLPFAIPDSFWWLAMVSTVWNLFEQTLIAVAFLVPRHFLLGRLRDAALLIFCFSIYAVVPVVSFGWLLLSMGVAQCDGKSSTLRVWYLFAFLVLIFYYEIPWAELLV